MTELQKKKMLELNLERENLLKQIDCLNRQLLINEKEQERVKDASNLSIKEFVIFLSEVLKRKFDEEYMVLDVLTLLSKLEQKNDPWHVIIASKKGMEEQARKKAISNFQPNIFGRNNMIYRILESQKRNPFYYLISAYRGISNQKVNCSLAKEEDPRGIYIPTSQFQFLTFLEEFVVKEKLKENPCICASDFEQFLLDFSITTQDASRKRTNL